MELFKGSAFPGEGACNELGRLLTGSQPDVLDCANKGRQQYVQFAT